MTYLANTRGTILRGSATDSLGDEVDEVTSVPALTDMPIGLIERSKNVQDPDTSTWRTIRYLLARIPPASSGKWGAPILDGDRLRDDRSGIIYPISEATVVARSLAGQASRTLTLTAVTGKTG